MAMSKKGKKAPEEELVADAAKGVDDVNKEYYAEVEETMRIVAGHRLFKKLEMKSPIGIDAKQGKLSGYKAGILSEKELKRQTVATAVALWTARSPLCMEWH